MADNTDKLVTLSNLSEHVAEIKRLLKQVRAYIDKKDDTKVDKVSGKQLSTNDYTTTEKDKLAGIEAGAQKNTVTGIKGNAESSYRTGNVNLTPANIGAAAASHTHSIGNVTNLQAALDGKAASSHTHAISNITNLQTTLDGKAAKSHTHSASEITSGTLSIDRIADKSITKEKLADGIFTDTDNILISTIYIDQNITDPASMISGDINGAAIQAIRANSHRFLGKYTASSGTMTICQLSDTDSTKFADGSAADLTGAQGDVFMRLPVFYTQAIELVEDCWQIKFAFGGQPEGERWMQWGGNDLIGVYEAYTSSSKIYSRSGVTPTGNILPGDFKAYARKRGTGFTLVKHKQHNIMAFLFYALYGNTNAQAICGSGTSSYPKTTGATNSLGMRDTTTANGNSMSINFWGLENWWGDMFEIEDNVIANGSTWNITEDDGTIRQLECFAGSNWNYPQKLVIGDNLDATMKPSSTSGSVSIGYCDGYYPPLNINCLVRRSGNASNETGGVVCLAANMTTDMSYENSGSRLAFTGNIIEEDNPETFKSLTAIG